MWCVVQVKTGTEEKIRQQIRTIISPKICQNCEIPYYVCKKRYLGEWHKEEKILFPGYVFLVTEEPEALLWELRKIPSITKLLRLEQEILSITEAEQKFLERLCGEEQKAEMSYGIVVNDTIQIISGPLKGMEGLVRKIDRHKRFAWIEQMMFGEKRLIRVGLEIVEKI